MPTPKRATTPDWEAIEADYRAGLLSLRTIATQHGTTETSIRRRAKKFGWQRDLTARIQARAQEILDSNAAGQAAEPEIIEANAASLAAIRLTHRKTLGQAQDLARQMLSELQVISGTEEGIRKLRDVLSNPNLNVQDPRLKALATVVTLPQRISMLRQLADAMSTFVNLERQSWGLDAKENQPKEPPPLPQDLISFENGGPGETTDQETGAEHEQELTEPAESGEPE